MLTLLLPLLRADLELTENYRCREGTPLSCPVTALAGVHDRIAPLSAMQGWGDVTTGGYTTQVFDGATSFSTSARTPWTLSASCWPSRPASPRPFPFGLRQLPRHLSSLPPPAVFNEPTLLMTLAVRLLPAHLEAKEARP